VVTTAKLPDGFALWPTKNPNPNRERWHSERDVLGEMMTGAQNHGLRHGVYYCGGWDWSFGGFPMTRLGSGTSIFQMPEYVAYIEAQYRELIDRYEPSILWNDIGYPEGGNLAGLLRHYFDVVPDGVVNNRFEAHARLGMTTPSEVYSDFVTPEYSTEGSPDLKWETSRGIGTSFGYNRQESESTHLSSVELIHLFIDIVARGGNLLLDISPTASGQIPWIKAQRLLDLGWWLRLNGDAIYGTRPWTRTNGLTGDGLGIRYTVDDDAVHAIMLGAPRSASVHIDVRLDATAQVSLEGRRDRLPWEISPVGTRITLPEVFDEQAALSLRLSPATAVRPFDETA
jgi:alpha-L-fucosidase